MLAGIAKLISDTQAFGTRLPEVLFAFIVGYIVVQVLVWSLARGLQLLRLPRALILIIQSLLAVILWIILFAHLLRMVGLSQVAITLSGSLFVIGLAIANGANTLVGDVISGLFLAKDPDFDIGFRIKSGDTEGVIESIDIRKTRIRTDKNTLYVLPNAVIDKERWEILSRPERKPRPDKKSATISGGSS